MRYISFADKFCAKKPIYGNYEIWSPTDQLIAKCDSRKANWYVKKQLADWVGEKAIKLQFEPEGRKHYHTLPHEDLIKQKQADDYYLQNKENMCVVCRALHPAIRKNVNCFGKWPGLDAGLCCKNMVLSLISKFGI